MVKGKTVPKPKRRSLIIKIALLIFLILVVAIAGYYIYQLYVVPQLTKLPVPTEAYPRNSVIYSYIIQGDNLNVKFGGKTIPAAQLTTELEKDMQAIKSVGFDGIKLPFDFKTNNYLADRIALKAAAQGLYPIGVLNGSFSKAKGQAFTPQEMTDWLKFVRDEVSANKNIIYYWEIWNEPSMSMFKYGSPAEFEQLLKETYPVIKEANPNARVITTLSAEALDSSGFEDQVLALGGGDYFDVLSFHPYGANPYLHEDQILTAITREKALVAKNNNRWPLVIGEIGQPTSEVTEAEQARLGAFVYQQAAKNNLPITWFYWSDERLPENYQGSGDAYNWGLIRYDGTARPILDSIRIYLEGEN